MFTWKLRSGSHVSILAIWLSFGFFFASSLTSQASCYLNSAAQLALLLLIFSIETKWWFEKNMPIIKINKKKNVQIPILTCDVSQLDLNCKILGFLIFSIMIGPVSTTMCMIHLIIYIFLGIKSNFNKFLWILA